MQTHGLIIKPSQGDSKLINIKESPAGDPHATRYTGSIVGADEYVIEEEVWFEVPNDAREARLAREGNTWTLVQEFHGSPNGIKWHARQVCHPV